MATDFQDDSKLQDLKPRTRFSSRQPTAQPTTEVKVAPAGAKTSKEQISNAFLEEYFFDDLASKPEALAAHMSKMSPMLGNFLHEEDYAATCDAKFKELLADNESVQTSNMQPSSNAGPLYGLSLTAIAPVLQNIVKDHPKAAQRLHKGGTEGLTPHLIDRFFELFDHDGNGVIDSQEFLHINRFFFAVANLEDLPMDAASADGNTTLGVGEVTEKADPISVDAEANKATNALLAQRLSVLWHVLPKTLDGTVSAEACWNSVLDDYQLKVMLDQPRYMNLDCNDVVFKYILLFLNRFILLAVAFACSTSTCGLAMLNSLKDIGALKTNSVGHVTEGEVRVRSKHHFMCR